MADENPTNPAAGGWRLALESLLLASVALFFLNFNPFGALSAGNRYSQDLVYGWFGHTDWLYPHAGPGRPRVVVLLLDDEALALRGARWPVPVDFHAQLLAELEVLRPRAVLLDFLLLDPATPEAACSLVSVAARLRASGTPTYVAVTRPGELESLAVGDCRDASGHALQVRDALVPVSVGLQVDGTDFVNRRYPFEERAAGSAAGSGTMSAAVRIYCDGTGAPQACARRLTEDYPRDAGFELAWSPAGDPFNRRWSEGRCDVLPSPTRAILLKEGLPPDTGCPPLPTLFATALFSPSDDPTLGARNEELFRLAEGAYVLVGGNFRGAGDLMTTPMHARLPGIYYHGVALDNLLSFDGRPKVRKQFRPMKVGFYAFDLAVLWVLAAIYLWRQRWIGPQGTNPPGPFSLSPSARAWIAAVVGRLPTALWVMLASAVLFLLSAFTLLQLVAVLLAAALLVAVELRLATRDDLVGRLRNLLLYLAAVAISLLVVAVAIGVGYRWLDLPPADWVGYLSFAAVGFFVAHTAILEFVHRVDNIHSGRRPGESDP